MRGATFKGGTHPFDGKELSKDLPVKKLLPTGEMVYPLSQHIGAPAEPVVQVGDSVWLVRRLQRQVASSRQIFAVLSQEP